MILNKRLRQLRITNNLTAKEFGNIFKISSSSVSLYENGKRTPSIDLIIKIAKYFNVSTDYLLGVTSLPNSTSSYIQDSNVDIAKIIEYTIHLMDTDENLVFKNLPIDNRFKNLFKNSLDCLVETYAFFMRNKHIS
ncbi:MAG: helix-turn-helix transcriptional regulator [Tissierellia bacterium]|nr:helix-turn-helix transcriptional regulator [Tissierellia bacterium]